MTTNVQSATTGLRPTKDEYGLIIANATSTRADCVRSRVGAAIFTRDGRVAALGFNGAPASRPGCLSSGACPRAKADVEPYAPYNDCIAIHAEANALLYADYGRIRGGTIYVTRRPCGDCRKLIQGGGIARVVYPDDENGAPFVELA